MFAGAVGGGGTLRVRHRSSMDDESVPVPASTLRRLFQSGREFPRIADILRESSVGASFEDDGEAPAERRPASGLEPGASGRLPAAGSEFDNRATIRRATLAHIERKATEARVVHPRPPRLAALRALASWRKVPTGVRLQALDDAVSAAVVVSVVLMVVENELYTSRGTSSVALRAAVSVLSALLVLLLYKSYELELHVMKISGQVPQSDTLWSSGMHWPFLLEAFVCTLHCPPSVHFSIWVEDTEADTYAYTEAMLGLTLFFKLYLIARSFRDHHSICQGGGRFLCNMNGCEPSLAFALKAHLEARPFVVLISITTANLVLSAYALTLCERARDPSYMYSNALWNLYIALTTVGFGDVIPHTYPGRSVVAVSVFFGLCTTALLISVVQDNLRLSKSQSRVLDTLRLARLQRAYRNSAVSCVQRLWRMHRKRRRAREAAAGRQASVAAEPPPDGADGARPASPTQARARRGGLIARGALRSAIQDFRAARRAWHEFVEYAAISPGEALEEVLGVVPRVAAIEAEVREVHAAVRDIREALLGQRGPAVSRGGAWAAPAASGGPSSAAPSGRQKGGRPPSAPSAPDSTAAAAALAAALAVRPLRAGPGP